MTPQTGAGSDAALHHAALSDIGMRREENQDSYGVFRVGSSTVFVVADGMGGVKGGAVASQLAVRALDEYLTGRSQLTVEDLATAALQANAAIFDRGIEQPELAGMGTTLVGLCFQHNDLYIINIGDSRAYRVREGAVGRLTEDHTLVTELLRSGAISEDQVENHPVSHMLTRSLGPTPLVEVDCWVCEDPPQPGDVYILCSDGLYNMISMDEIGEIASASEPGEAAARMIELANMRGGTDNITVILVKVPPRPAPVAPEVNERRASEEAPGITDTLELPEPLDAAAPAEDAVPEPAPEDNISTTLGDVLKAFEPGWNENANGHQAETIEPLEIKGSIALTNVLVHKDREVRSVAQEEGCDAAPEDPRPLTGVKAGAEDACRPESPPAAIRPSRGRLQTLALGVLIVAFALLGYLVGSSSPGKETTVMNPEPVSTPQSVPPEPARTLAARPSPAPQPVGESPFRGLFGDDEASKDDVRPEFQVAEVDLQRVTRSLQRLKERVAKLNEQITSFDRPISGEMERMLNEGRTEILGIEGKLRDLQEEKRIAENKNKLWVGRSRRLGNANDLETSISLAQEIAPVAQAVNEVWQGYLLQTQQLRREDEVLSYNPNDMAQSQKVGQLLMELAQKRREINIVVRRTVDEEKNGCGEELAELSLREDALNRSLEELKQEQEYVKALFTSDPALRAQTRKKLIDERALAELQLKEQLRLLPDNGAAANPTSEPLALPPQG